MKLITPKDNEIVIFTDGSARGNPGPGGFGVVAVYPDAHGEIHVDELGGREDMTTNNRMELRAVIEAIKNFINYYENLSTYTFSFYVDSSYVVKGVSVWMAGWKRNNWTNSMKDEVKNRDLWEELSDLLEKGDGHGKIKASWVLIEGHAGITGNERCDIIATSYADNKPTDLFKGTLASYQNNPDVCDLLNIEAKDQDKKDALKLKKKNSSSAKAFSYVSLVDGKIQTHSQWKDCEDRVKGKSKVRFKKSISKEDEEKIIQDFLKNS